MKRRLLKWLVCPECRTALDLTVERESADEIEEGRLLCPKCGKSFPIVRGIARFVPSDGYASSFGRQWNRYAQLQLDSQTGTPFSRQRFYSITEWDPSALKGTIVLDVGCGAGRFSEVVLQDGAEVVSVDLSSAIDACRRNLGANPRHHCVQASIYALPFPDSVFDYVYCIGVIQHTPDPRRSVLNILPKVRHGGRVGLWIYELNWKSFIGTAGFRYAFRPWTKRLRLEQMETLAARLESLCWPVNRWARRRGIPGKAVMRLLPVACAHLHGIPLTEEDFREWVRLDTFDMYSPAHDHPQRFSTVRLWLEDAGFRVDPRHPHGAISITGTRSS